MKQIVTQAIVLNRTNFGEADRIIVVITPTGKESLLAKGVRKERSKLAGGIELFSICELTFLEGRGELRTLISSRLVKHYKHIVTKLDRTMLAYRILKMINTLTEQNLDAEYFELLVQSLELLDNDAVSLELTEVWFLAHLLSREGHGINIETDAQGHQLAPKDKFIFDYQVMSFAKRPGGTYTGQHIKLLRIVLQLKKPEQLAQITNTQSTAQDLAVLVRSVMGHTYNLRSFD